MEKIRPEVPEGLPKDLRMLLAQCFEFVPSRRPSAGEIVQVIRMRLNHIRVLQLAFPLSSNGLFKSHAELGARAA